MSTTLPAGNFAGRDVRVGAAVLEHVVLTQKLLGGLRLLQKFNQGTLNEGEGPVQNDLLIKIPCFVLKKQQ